MPTPKIPFGPFKKVYIGKGPPDTGVLTLITDKRTKGGFLSNARAEAWVSCRQNYLPTSSETVGFSLTFMGASDNVVKIARGLWLTDEVDARMGYQKYTVLLLSPRDGEHYLIPECAAIKNLTINREKLATTIVPVQFSFQSRESQLYHQGTLDELDTLLAARSPL